MKKQVLSLFFSALFILLIMQSNVLTAQCQVSAIGYPMNVCAGDNITLSATGGCGIILTEDFEDTTLAPGWSSSGPPVFSNPCGLGPSGVYCWFESTSGTRELVTESYDLTVTGCKATWYMRYGASHQQGPCQNPDHPDKGVTLQWSTDNGATWTDFPGVNQYPTGHNHYTDNGTYPDDFLGTTTTPGTGGQWDPTPGGTHFGNYPPGQGSQGHQPSDNTYYWHLYESHVPQAALTSNTSFRWAQFLNDGDGQDTWGVDAIAITCPSSSINVLWSHGPTVLNPPSVTLPDQGGAPYDTCFTVTVSDTISSATDTVCINVIPLPNVKIGYDWIQSDMITYIDESTTNMPPGTTTYRNWDFGTSHADPATSTLDTVTVQYYQPGAYTTTLSVVAGGCIASDSLITTITSMEEIEKNTPVKIFPSPVREHITIQLPDEIRGKTLVSILNINGTLVKTHQINDSQNETRLNLSQLSAGSYIVRINNDSQTWHYKIMVVN